MFIRVNCFWNFVLLNKDGDWIWRITRNRISFTKMSFLANCRLEMNQKILINNCFIRTIEFICGILHYIYLYDCNEIYSDMSEIPVFSKHHSRSTHPCMNCSKRKRSKNWKQGNLWVKWKNDFNFIMEGDFSTTEFASSIQYFYWHR